MVAAVRPGCGHQGRVEPIPTDERLWRAVRGFEEPELPLEAGEGEHPVVAKGGRELLGRESVDLVPPYVMKLNTKPSFPSSSGNCRISSSLSPVVSQLNDGDRLYASILSG